MYPLLQVGSCEKVTDPGGQKSTDPTGSSSLDKYDHNDIYKSQHFKSASQTMEPS